MLQFKDIREFLLLHAAAEGGHESVVEAFLENGAEVDSAIQTDDEANITVEIDYSRTALMLAAHEGRTPVVKLLLGKGAELEPIGSQWPSGTTALVQAALTCNVEIVRLLLRAGANFNARDFRFDNTTSLHLAIPHRAAGHSDSDEIVTMLIESGADLEAQDRRGETPLAKAVQMGQVAITQLLLERGADPNSVEATVTSSRGIYEVVSQTALELVQEAQKTWKAKETGSNR